jgi:transcription elongation factor GreA
MTQEVFLTEQGYQELEEKLTFLKTVQRQEISERIKIAREFGDISENAEYDAAKNDQAQIEGEIAEIEVKLRNAKIIEEVSSTEVVSIGCSVKIQNMDVKGKEPEIYKIVGTTESNPLQKRISNESPVGKACIGAKVGQTVTVLSPQGKQIKYKVLEIQSK